MNYQNSTRILLLALVIVATMIGCTQPATPEQPSTPQPAAAVDDVAAIMGVEWKLEAVARPGSAVENVNPDPPYTVQFLAGGRLAGVDNCNRHTGQFELLPEQGLSITAGVTTRMMCIKPSLKGDFSKMLATATKWHLSEGKLVLEAADGLALTFARGAAATVSYICKDDVEFKVRVEDNQAEVEAPAGLGGRKVLLPQVEAASGARYEKDGNVFWSHGSEAMFAIAGKSFNDCNQN